MQKKILMGALVAGVFTFTGCNKVEDLSLNLNSIENKIVNLNDGVFSVQMVNTDIMEEYSEPLTYIYDFEYEELFNLDKTYVDSNDSVIKYNSETNELLAIINYIDKDEVEKSMDEFCEELECTITEYENYLIYINSSDNDSVITDIKNSNTPIFNEMLKAEGEFFESTTKISEDDLEEYLMQIPAMMTSSATYIILNPKEGKEESVKQAMEEYMANLEKSWEMYLPDQYDLVKNRLEVEYGEYLIYIISSDNELVLETIKG